MAKIKNNIKTTIIIVAVLFLSACSGYRYSMIEDNNFYFLKGDFYNNNPFIDIKARIPNSYLIKKTPNRTATKEDIKSTNNYNTKIIDGVIIDQQTYVEIKLNVHDSEAKQDHPAFENGKHNLSRRQHVDDLNVFLKNNEKDIYEKFRHK